MLTIWSVKDGHCLVREGGVSEITAALPPPQNIDAAAIVEPDALRASVWIDLLNPSHEEERAVQDALRLEIPTREEMQEIESSSRLYREGDALFLTANFLYGVEGGEYGSTAISFVLTPTHLITVRYATPKAFSVFNLRAQRMPGTLLASPDAVMLHLFEQVVDRLADILERIGADMDRASQSAFRSARGQKVKANRRDADLRDTLITLGQVGEVTTRASETLLGLTRILTFVGAEKATAVRKENQVLIKTLVRDVRSLVEHANFLNSKANFLLDAVLGIINVEQNSIIKTFTVAAVALMPPTLVASIYGMNFESMPELKWEYGYPAAVVVMILSAILPVLYFRRKGWL
ncbi:magnesium/cobalt transporter CorA [Plastoroseomonas hellenica]|uniref:Magnesium transport protein CorA n=1 Tax=Plastoroseomonas hellenica TaxID=2687306 RepID=A0ABS5F743_9PROT|nr:magnesium/cobalt transporter CorA [Plastoroseomonas hellenica]MBR0646586.1 magnesium/cobalt transporter CorA [Plastoroseomonas hellenica]MBR0668406.1 magnesium/cobalt transporter CorA [Plastoroseomonas hellenica]